MCEFVLNIGIKTSPLSYAGGKTEDLHAIRPKIPKTIANHLRNAVYVKATAVGKAACDVKD